MWYLQESNQGHTDFQSVALPTELRYHAHSAGANITLFSLLQRINLKKIDGKLGPDFNRALTRGLDAKLYIYAFKSLYAFNPRCRKYPNQMGTVSAEGVGSAI